ncbi:MAG: hypothetical protein Q8O13_00870 [Candidatus Omnitrophota bacterium]|nr:hypothetical protein [Candidatus Omnitrophota bacterium]
MRRCARCNVPLDGFLGKVAKTVFKVSTSEGNPDICNKCADSRTETDSAIESDTPGKYRCQICEREIDERVALTHIKSEEYIINLIKKDHPKWDKDKNTCHECREYYRRLIKEAEI